MFFVKNAMTFWFQRPEQAGEKELSLFYNKTGEITKVFYGKITIKS